MQRAFFLTIFMSVKNFEEGMKGKKKNLLRERHGTQTQTHREKNKKSQGKRERAGGYNY